MLSSLAVFVNSSDGFQDCWPPFFELYSRYSGELLSVPVYLNTEKVGYTYPGVSITACRTWPDGKSVRPSWSECLIRGLDTVQEPYVLYLHEDYFLTVPVDSEVIGAALEVLREHPNVGVVYLNKYGPQFQRSRPFTPGFVQIERPASYLVSTQAAIWRKEFLASLVRPWENGWMFEKFASMRVRRLDYKLISVNQETMQARPVMDYIYTGVIKGQWKSDCVELFEKHGISVDFHKRGFYRDMGRLKSRFEVLKKLIGQPGGAVRSILSIIK